MRAFEGYRRKALFSSPKRKAARSNRAGDVAENPETVEVSGLSLGSSRFLMETDSPHVEYFTQLRYERYDI